MLPSHIHGNQGYMQTGGSASIDVLAVGQNANASKTVSGNNGAHEDHEAIVCLRTQLSELLKKMEDQKQEFSPEAMDAVNTAKAEADKEKPNKLVLSSVLDGVANAVKSVAAISGAVVEIMQQVAKL